MNFSHITDWVFDLDNTLYPRHCDLFSQIDWKMTAYVENLTGFSQADARALQKQLYRDHGTTLNGLMAQYDIDPHDYLAKVHDIDYSQVEHNPSLGKIIEELPGRKHVFTNGDVAHAENTLKAIGIDGVFEGIFDIVAADFVPKPDRRPYQAFFKSHSIEPQNAIMFEDMSRNLEIPKSVGMATVLVVPKEGTEFSVESWELSGQGEKHIDHVTDDLDLFLTKISTD